jgi:putative two-component system response regulator
MNTSTLTVLIVDDVEENVILLSRYLDAGKYTVRSAFNGREAFTTLNNEKIDLVILDINMPIIDGITVLKNMKDNPELATIPVIMLTAMDDRKTTMECMRLGACGYVTKPFSLNSLKQQVENCLLHV